MSTPSTFAIAYAPSAPSSDPAPSAPSSDPVPGGNTSPPAPNTFSVGGSVSGLSGTVVLQDNGGDDLSVSSDGPFTFATPVGRWWRLQRHGQEQPERPDVHDVGCVWHRRVGERDQCRGHVHQPDDVAAGRGRLQPARWWSGRRLGGDQRRRPVDRVAGGARNRQRAGGRHPDRRELRQRPVLADRGDLDPAHRRRVDRAGRAQPKRRPGHLSGHLLLEQRQPAATALQAHRRHLHPARQQLQQRPAARRHQAHAHRRRLHDLLPARRHHTNRRDRHHPHRRRPRPDDLRRRHQPTTGPAAHQKRSRLVGACLGCRERWCCRTMVATI